MKYQYEFILQGFSLLEFMRFIRLVFQTAAGC